MKINEAIEHAKEVSEKKYLKAMLCHANPDDGNLDECIECARQHEQLAEWLQELNECKQLGTIEEFRDAMEKQIPKKPREVLGIYDNTEYECKCCGDEIPKRCRFYNYCPHCGQRLDWEE